MLPYLLPTRTQEYQSAVEEIDRQLNIIGNAGKKTVLTQAKENLKNEYFGKDVKEFVSKVMALPEAEFVKHLDKEWKGKLDGRLASWYGSNVSNDWIIVPNTLDPPRWTHN